MKWYSAMIATGLALMPASAFSAFPDYYPADYQAIVDAATAEGKVILYAPLSTTTLRPLIEGFQTEYPGISVELNDLNTVVIYNRFISEAAGGAQSADLLWSSALDLQAKLVTDGHSLDYASPESAHLPDWAVWQGKGAYGTTFEPMIFAYNKDALKPEQVPQTHADIARLITENLDTFSGRIASYNIETAGLGFFAITQDSKLFPEFWTLAKALGAASSRFYSSTGEMIESIASGENVFGYNQPSHASSYGRDNPSLGIVFPQDYLVIASRMAFVTAKAKNPNAGKLFLDYMLSQRGQQIIDGMGFHSLRDDVTGPMTREDLTKTYGDRLKPPVMGPELLEFLDQDKRLEFLDTWKSSLSAGQ